MPDDALSKKQMPRRLGFLRVPLFRLLAINLAIGVTLAALLVGGLLALNPGGLRDLILADSSPGTALGLLLFGFVVTFGSTAMGTAIMAMGRQQTDDEPPRGTPLLVAQRAGQGEVRAKRQPGLPMPLPFVPGEQQIREPVIGKARDRPHQAIADSDASQPSAGVTCHIAIATSAPTISRPASSVACRHRRTSSSEVTMGRECCGFFVDVAEGDVTDADGGEQLVALPVDAGVADRTARVVPDGEAMVGHERALQFPVTFSVQYTEVARRFNQTVRVARNRFAHEANAFPRSAREVESVLSEMGACFLLAVK